MSSALAAIRDCFAYASGENRATGYVYDGQAWLAPFAQLGPVLLGIYGGAQVVFQAYRDGSASCDLHTEPMRQTILSLGATRRFCLGGESLVLAHGDVLTVEAGVVHGVPPDPSVSGERVSLVFRD